jgi:hypothetical protein
MESLNNFNFTDKRENQAEKESLIEAELTAVEQKGQEVANLLESMGGAAGVKKTLESMNAERIKELNEKIKVAADKLMTEKSEAIETACLIEMPAMVAAALAYIEISLPEVTTRLGEASDAGMVIFASVAAAIPVLTSIHDLITEKKLFSGIEHAIRARREKKNWKKFVAERDSLESA